MADCCIILIFATEIVLQRALIQFAGPRLSFLQNENMLSEISRKVMKYSSQETGVGLTPEEVEASRSVHGYNRLTPPAKESLWKAFFEKFKDPLIIVLLVVMMLSAGIAGVEYFRLGASASVFLEPLGVLVALLLATGVGFIFEVRAAKAFDILNQVNDDTPVKVIRRIEGRSQITEVPRYEIVVGDIVSLEAGEEIPADGRLLESVSLSVNESTLTGEPLTHKSADPEVIREKTGETYAADRLMKGSTIIEGHGLMVVTEVGDATEYGHVYEATQIDDGIKTPLNAQLDQLGRVLSWAAFIVAGLIFVGRMLYLFLDGDGSNNDEFLEVMRYVLGSVMIAVTLVVVSVPEGLPLSITLSLALSMKKMLKQNNLVRKLHACETMGAATVICTDKTGTLTQNRMQVAEMRNFLAEAATDASGKEQAAAFLAEAIAVNSTAWIENDRGHHRVLGNPTEGALLLWLASAGIDYLPLRSRIPIVSQEPFTTETKRMTTTSMSAVFGRRVIYVKGAPELLLQRCTRIAGAQSRSDIESLLFRYQEQAMRTLGFAYAVDDNLEEWTFFALAAITDPVRTEVPEAIRTCRNAGIDVVIVTGDTAGTALEIGRQIGLAGAVDAPGQKESAVGRPVVLSGPEFGDMSDEEAMKILPDVGNPGSGLKILSRARPLDKQRLVRLLQRKHHVVAVTGDGTNDAPALTAAHVGLSMGDGTAVAKEASDITIIDNSFSSITKAVLWGRSLYNNIGRFILFQMTVNVAACFIVLVGAFLGKESPLSVTQMLWVNLIMDTFAAMALSSLPADGSVMNDRPRRPRAHIIDRFMLGHILGWGSFISAILLWCWLSGLSHHYFFTIFVMLQFWNLFNARYYRTGRSLIGDLFGSAEGRRRMKENWSWSFMGIAGLILAGQLLIVNLGGEMFNIETRLTPCEWLCIIGATSLILWIGDAFRWFASLRRHKASPL